MKQTPQQNPKAFLKKLLLLLIVSIISIALFKACFSNKTIGEYKKEDLPDNFEYAIIKDESDSRLNKNQLLVQIPQKLTVGQIATLAEELYNSKPKMKRFYIGYLLPDMKEGAGAWAISNFEPDIKIEILGTTVKGEIKALNNLEKTPGEVVGKWYERQKTDSYYTIFKTEKGIFLRKFIEDGDF